MVKIWHNPKCSKSRASLELLLSSQTKMSIYKYLEESPTIESIQEILRKLNYDAKELMRKGEDIYIELNIDAISDELSLIKLLVKHPTLIERPIIIKGDKAVIGRPIKKVHKLLNI